MSKNPKDNLGPAAKDLLEEANNPTNTKDKAPLSDRVMSCLVDPETHERFMATLDGLNAAGIPLNHREALLVAAKAWNAMEEESRKRIIELYLPRKEDNNG